MYLQFQRRALIPDECLLTGTTGWCSRIRSIKAPIFAQFWSSAVRESFDALRIQVEFFEARVVTPAIARLS